MIRVEGELTYKAGWSGGTYLIEGKSFRFNVKDKAKVSIYSNRQKIEVSSEAEFGIVYGSDYDSGHTYKWTLIDIFVETIPRVFVPARHLDGYRVYIELERDDN